MCGSLLEIGFDLQYLSALAQCHHVTHKCPSWCSQEHQQDWEERQIPGPYQAMCQSPTQSRFWLSWWNVVTLVNLESSMISDPEKCLCTSQVGQEMWSAQPQIWVAVRSISSRICCHAVCLVSLYWQPQPASCPLRKQDENTQEKILGSFSREGKENISKMPQ